MVVEFCPVFFLYLRKIISVYTKISKNVLYQNKLNLLIPFPVSINLYVVNFTKWCCNNTNLGSIGLWWNQPVDIILSIFFREEYVYVCCYLYLKFMPEKLSLAGNFLNWGLRFSGFFLWFILTFIYLKRRVLYRDRKR